MKDLELRKVDWGKNPAVTRDNIEYNFRVLSDAYQFLAQSKLSEWTLESINAGHILSASTDLSSIFMLRDERNDTVRISCGDNVMTGGTPNRPVIRLSPSPFFKNITAKNASFGLITSGNTDLSSLFYTREEAKNLSSPALGSNLLLTNGVLSVAQHVFFTSLTANTASFNEIIYKGRPLDDLFPSHKMSDGIPYLQLRKVDWETNPAIMRDDIDSNFRSIAHAYAALLEHDLEDIKLKRINADEILSGSTPLGEMFLAKDAYHDVVRLQSGSNIVTGGTQNKPIINVVRDPMFDSVSAFTGSFHEVLVRGKSLSEIYFTRREAETISHPELGENMGRSEDGKTIHVTSDPYFDSVRCLTFTADTVSFDEAKYKGRKLDTWFGSHTFVKAGRNISTGGTAHAPVLSVVPDPSFDSIRAEGANVDELVTTSLTASSIHVQSIQSDALSVGALISTKEDGLSLNNDLHLFNGCITIGAPPEREISAFLRTKMRLVAPDSSPIHYALVVQNKEHAEKRVLNEATVDFVVRGDGHVGIGAFSGLTSKLTIKSLNGHDQFRMVTPFTPKDTHDPQGDVGNIAWDEDYTYVRTASGWKRTRLDAF